MFEKPYHVPRVFELMDVGPYFGLPRLLMRGRFAASGTARVEFGRHTGNRPGPRRQLHEYAPDLLDLLVGPDKMFVT